MLRVFLPGVTDIGERLLRAYAIEVARVDQNGDGALSFAEAEVEGFSDGLPNTRLYLSVAYVLPAAPILATFREYGSERAQCGRLHALG